MPFPRFAARELASAPTLLAMQNELAPDVAAMPRSHSADEMLVIPPMKTWRSIVLGALAMLPKSPPGRRVCSLPSEPDHRFTGRSLLADWRDWFCVLAVPCGQINPTCCAVDVEVFVVAAAGLASNTSEAVGSASNARITAVAILRRRRGFMTYTMRRNTVSRALPAPPQSTVTRSSLVKSCRARIRCGTADQQNLNAAKNLTADQPVFSVDGGPLWVYTFVAFAREAMRI